MNLCSRRRLNFKLAIQIWSIIVCGETRGFNGAAFACCVRTRPTFFYIILEINRIYLYKIYIIFVVLHYDILLIFYFNNLLLSYLGHDMIPEQISRPIIIHFVLIPKTAVQQPVDLPNWGMPKGGKTKSILSKIKMIGLINNLK